MDDFYQWQENDLIVNLKVQPKASRDEISGLQGNALKVRITAPPVDGKANKHLINYLSDIFDVAKSNIQLISGHSGRDKRIRVHAPKALPDLIKRPSPGTDSRHRTP